MSISGKYVTELYNKIQEERPIIHCITNAVTVNDCANILLAAGASPTMAHHPLEVEEITAGTKALVCNFGAIADYEAMEKAAEDIYEKLQNAGVEVLLDDRKERPGVKFKDADLMGIPVAITVGRAAADGKVEFKLRRDAEKQELTIEEAVAKTIEIVNREKDGRHFFNK